MTTGRMRRLLRSFALLAMTTALVWLPVAAMAFPRNPG
jgi:hypothetical protein